MSILVWSKDGLTCDYHFIGMVNWPIGHWSLSWWICSLNGHIIVHLFEFIINRKTETGAAADEEERDSDGHSKTTHSTLHFTITNNQVWALKNPNFWFSAQAGVWQRKAEKRVEVESPDWRAYTGAQSRRGIGWKWSTVFRYMASTVTELSSNIKNRTNKKSFSFVHISKSASLYVWHASLMDCCVFFVGVALKCIDGSIVARDSTTTFTTKVVLFSCPEQLNRWPCHSMTFWFWHYRVTLDFSRISLGFL